MPANHDTWRPEQYEKFKAERAEPFFDLLALVEPRPQPVCVDLGCGTGELTAVLHERLAARSTLGIDNSPRMLAQAFPRATGSLRFARLEIERFPASNTQDRYDLIFSNAALHWVPDHPGLFERLRGALGAGGQLAVQLPANHDSPAHTLASRLAADPHASPVLAAEDYARLLFRLGFRHQKVLTRVYGHVLESRAQVLEWMRGTTLTCYESRMSGSEFADFLRRYETGLYRLLPDERPFFYPFKRVLLWGAL